MFKKKLLLLQNSFGVVPKSTPASSSTPTPVLTPYITSFQKLLLMRNVLESNIQQGSRSGFSSTGILQGFASFQTDLTFDSFGVMSLNGSISPSIAFNNSLSGSRILQGQNSSTIDFSTSYTGGKNIAGNTTFSLPIILIPTGGRNREGALNFVLNLISTQNGNIIRGGNSSLITTFGFSGAGIRDIGGFASLLNEFTLDSILNGRFSGSANTNVLFALASTGYLTSENVVKVVGFELSIQQLKELDLAVKQLITW